jgi:hypothetical protein
MNLQLEKPYVEAMLNRFSDLGFLAEQLKFGNRAEVPFQRFSDEHMHYLKDLYTQAGPALHGKVAQISTLQNAICANDPKFTRGDLERLVPEITRYLTEHAERGWLFKINAAGKPLAYLVTRIDFTPPGEEESGRILIDLKTHAAGKITTNTVLLLDKDIDGQSIAQMFATKGYMRETPELLASYDASAAKYFDWRAQYGRQFVAQGTGIYAEDPTATHRSQDWSRKSVVVLSSGGGFAKLVNDEEIIQNRELMLDTSGDILGKFLRKAGRNMKFSDSVEKATEKATEKAQQDIPDGLFTQLPVQGFVLMLHLELHHHLWVHVDDMQLYEYQLQLREKLVLPPEQTDLIDILTAEMDVLMDDIVEGKSGGTTVLCAGPAGVGKTLTDEVYSEIIKRPLYRVHSGQLGLSVAEMEKALKETLTRAQRWGAVMLIDEADVYIKRRNDNIAANAVVGVFLRVLEYFNGLLFLTTNRVGDIDEAIVSRCIALIKYLPPDLADRKRIWQVMTEQFKLPVAPELIDVLAERFPTACGRDIKGLSKLVAKYCQYKSAAPTLDVFERCSIFRGMDIAAA